MPFASGLGIISAVRESINAETPVIILSSLGQEDVVAEAFDLGANDFIIKPFNPIELSVRIKKLLNK